MCVCVLYYAIIYRYGNLHCIYMSQVKNATRRITIHMILCTIIYMRGGKEWRETEIVHFINANKV